MSRPTFVTVAGRRTRVRVEGDPTNPPVLLLHGVSRSLEDWALQYPRLSATYRLIALDLPGSGFSVRTPETTDLEVLGRAVVETLDVLGELRPVHVVGNSLGGAIGLELLGRSPGRVASLVLVNSAGFGAEAALALRLMTVPVLGELMTRRATRFGARMSERLGVADKRLVNTVRIEHALEIAKQPDTGAVLLETLRSLADLRAIRPGWRSRLIAQAAPHPRPTLVMWGDRDEVLPAHHLEAAARFQPHAELTLFAETGHMPQIERPEEFAARVLAFLRDAQTSAGSAEAPIRKPNARKRSRSRSVASPA